MGRLQGQTNYENLRNARILENQARLKTLGVQKTISELRSIASSTKPSKAHVRNYSKKVYDVSFLRRSDRLKQIPPEPEQATHSLSHTCLRRSNRLKGKPISGKPVLENASPRTVAEKIRPANMPFLDIKGSELRLSPQASALRCSNKGRGSIYDSVFGICCHFCRQKKLCGEEDCKRCSNLDMEEPCIGKTDCSVCHSSNGVLCRACLKVRYGEEMKEVRENKDWMCPHCIEEKGIKPYWICNSSLCLNKRKIAPTGIAIYRAQELGYKSVAHLLMDELKGATKWRRMKIW